MSLVIGGWLGTLAFWFAFQQRRLASEHLSCSLQLSDEQSVRTIAKQCFQNLCKTVVEFMRFPRLDKQQIRQYVKLEGVEHVTQALAQGKGAIILTGHFGNW